MARDLNSTPLPDEVAVSLPARWRHRIGQTRRHLLAPLVDVRDWFLLGPRQPMPPRRNDVAARVPRDPPPFFILGSPRSGTTLLRQMINRHPDVFIPPENGEIQNMVSTYGRLRKSPWPDVVHSVLRCFAAGYEANYWAIDLELVASRARALPQIERSLAGIFNVLYEEYGRCHAPGKRRWGDKSTPGHFEYLNKFGYVFPQARIIHIVRDGRDSVQSCVQAGFYGGSYLRAAHAWAENVRACDRFGLRCGPERFLTIRYEDMVDSPALVLRHVCGFLDITFDPGMTSIEGDVHRVSADVRALAHHRNVLRPVSVASIGAWRNKIPAQWRPRVLSLLRGELRSHGYDLS